MGEEWAGGEGWCSGRGVGWRRSAWPASHQHGWLPLCGSTLGVDKVRPAVYCSEASPSNRHRRRHGRRHRCRLLLQLLLCETIRRQCHALRHRGVRSARVYGDVQQARGPTLAFSPCGRCAVAPPAVASAVRAAPHAGRYARRRLPWRRRRRRRQARRAAYTLCRGGTRGE